jgi:hypothetical protein
MSISTSKQLMRPTVSQTTALSLTAAALLQGPAAVGKKLTGLGEIWHLLQQAAPNFVCKATAAPKTV